MGGIVIPFCTGSGHTRRLAELVAEGAGGATLIDVESMEAADWARLESADAVIFGAPTYMGGPAAAFKAFMDASGDLWADQLWADKIAAGFTVSTFPAGDKHSTLAQLVVFAAQHGMIWVGQSEIGAPVFADRVGINVSGDSLGLTATSSSDKTRLIDEADAETARRFGARIAAAALRWSRGAT